MPVLRGELPSHALHGRLQRVLLRERRGGGVGGAVALLVFVLQ